MKRTLLRLCLSSLAIATACSSSPSNDDGGPPDATNDVQQQNDSSTDSGKSDSPSDAPASDGSDASDAASETSTDASDGGITQVTLTVNDYIGWCKVTVNGGTSSTSGVQTYMFAPNTVVTAQGDTASVSSFYWGYWGNVAADGGLADGGEDLSKTVTFTITSDVTLNACCPDNGQPLTQCTF
jgi:hypothetical protein